MSQRLWFFFGSLEHLPHSAAVRDTRCSVVVPYLSSKHGQNQRHKRSDSDKLRLGSADNRLGSCSVVDLTKVSGLERGFNLTRLFEDNAGNARVEGSPIVEASSNE